MRDLLDATQARYRDELHQSKPPAFLLYIDQGEELYVRADERQRRRFSEILADGIGDPRLLAMMSMRADFFGELQKDEALYAVHRLVSVPPLREAELHKVVSQPAKLLSARFETERLAADIAQLAAEHGVHPVQISQWKAAALKGLPAVFEKEGKDEIRSEIIDNINHYLITGKVKNLYFEDFLVN